MIRPGFAKNPLPSHLPRLDVGQMKYHWITLQLTTMAKRIVLNVIKVIAGIAVEVGYV
jgi:hypothetical protein